jgi:medium-chain acyl-[acyl-carrier-protein] hydrolase
MQADVKLAQSYRYRPGEPLSVPITAFGGIEDPWISEAQLAAWEEQTDSAFDIHMIPGGHFFLREEKGRQSLMAHLRSLLIGVGREEALL